MSQKYFLHYKLFGIIKFYISFNIHKSYIYRAKKSIYY